MTQHDVSQWPLVVSIIDSQTLNEDLREVAARWRDWLSWNEPFAALQIFSACDEGMLAERDRVLELVAGCAASPDSTQCGRPRLRHPLRSL